MTYVHVLLGVALGGADDHPTGLACRAPRRSAGGACVAAARGDVDRDGSHCFYERPEVADMRRGVSRVIAATAVAAMAILLSRRLGCSATGKDPRALRSRHPLQLQPGARWSEDSQA